jgi:hypothetical protein
MRFIDGKNSFNRYIGKGKIFVGISGNAECFRAETDGANLL